MGFKSLPISLLLGDVVNPRRSLPLILTPVEQKSKLFIRLGQYFRKRESHSCVFCIGASLSSVYPVHRISHCSSYETDSKDKYYSSHVYFTAGFFLRIKLIKVQSKVMLYLHN